MLDQQMRQLSSSYTTNKDDKKLRRRAGMEQASRNAVQGARKSVQSRSRELDRPSQYIDVVSTSKASRALPSSIMACRTSIQSMQT